MPPFAGGKIAPALLLRRHPEKVELPGQSIITTPYPPTVDDGAIVELFPYVAGSSVTKTYNAVNTYTFAERTITRSEMGNPSVGNLLIVMYGAGAWEFGAGNIVAASTQPASNWGDQFNNTQITANASDTARRACGINARIATGDVFDDVVTGGVGNGEPSFMTVQEFIPINGALPRTIGQNMYSFNNNKSLLADFPMNQCELSIGPFPNYNVSIFVSVKRASPTQTGSLPIPLLGTGVTTIVTGASPDPVVGFGGLLFACGYRIDAISPYTFVEDDWAPTIGYSGDSFSCAGRYATQYSTIPPP